MAELMSDRDVEAFTGGKVKGATLRWWRHADDGTGPKWFRIGRKVYYRREDVVAWLDAQYAATNGGR